MNDWENWTFSLENEILISGLSLKGQNASTNRGKLWWDLFNFSPSSGVDVDLPLEGKANQSEVNEKGMENIVICLRESLESKTLLQETAFTGIPHNSLYRIFQSVKNDLDDLKFSTLCEFIAFWNNDFLIEQALRALVLPKLQEKNESSACIIFSLTKLAESKPSQLCQNVLIDLLSDGSTFQFTDAELLKNIFPVLPTPQKDLLILSLSNKEDFKETDWLLLQSLVNSLSPMSVVSLIECIHKWSSKFTKSLLFGRFLVNFCKYLNFPVKKELLVEAIEMHETLLKRQALKYLEQS